MDVQTLKARVLRSRASCRRQGGRGRDREARYDSEHGIAERDIVELQTSSSHRAHNALCAADVPRAGSCWFHHSPKYFLSKIAKKMAMVIML